MNEMMETILNRRSVRSFKKDQIKDEELEQILQAGKFAPSGMNKQPWHFTAVQNAEMLNKINDGCKMAIQKTDDKNFSAFYNAPTLIILSGDEKAITSQYDCSAALENMFLAAESLGIGSCWIFSVQASLNAESRKDLKKALGIPEGYKVICAGAFGYNASEPSSPAPRRDNTVNIIR